MTKILQEKSIRFRWDISEGLWIFWKDKNLRINTIEKAKQILEEIQGKEDVPGATGTLNTVDSQLVLRPEIDSE